MTAHTLTEMIAAIQAAMRVVEMPSRRMSAAQQQWTIERLDAAKRTLEALAGK